MDFKQLTYFITTVQEGNISKAAQKLHISQPPLSTKLKELETELGVILFERGSRKIALTEAGHIFYARAISILELMDVAKKELEDYTQGKMGTLRIGIISSISSTLANEWLSAFHHLYPEISFHLFEGNTYEQLERLRNNLIELAIVRTPFTADDLECTVLRKEKVFAVGANHYFTTLDTPTVTLAQICASPLILYRRWEQVIKTIYSEQKLIPNIFCMNDDARTTASMVNAGLGIGILPESALTLLSDSSITHKIIQEDSLASSICILRNPTSYLSTVVELFYSFLKTYHKDYY